MKQPFPERKSITLLFRALIKTEILTSCEVLYTKLVRVIRPCFAKKMLSKLRVFPAENVSSSSSMFLNIFYVSADKEMGK